MQTIERDETEIQAYRQVMQARLSRWRNSLDIAVAGTKRNLNGASALLSTAQTYAGYLSVVEPTSPELCRAVRLGARAAALVFEAASTTASEIVIGLDEGEDVSVSLAEFDASGADAGKWLTGYFLAVICNDKPALNSLSHTPLATLRRSAGKVSEYAFHYVDMIQAMQRGETWGQRLKTTLNATNPAQLEESEKDFVLHMRVPELDLWWRLGERDAHTFNSRLAWALTMYRDYSKLEHRAEPDTMHPKLYIAWGILALCCLARRLGITVEVRSDYLPAPLLNGDCEVGVDAFGPVASVLMCPYCKGEITAQTQLCPHCGQDTRRDAVIQYSLSKFAEMPRAACQFCGRAVIADAIFCPFCRNLRRPQVWQG